VNAAVEASLPSVATMIVGRLVFDSIEEGALATLVSIAVMIRYLLKISFSLER
jgi:hypothetical protein